MIETRHGCRPQSLHRLKVAFINHVGDAMGGAEQTLLTTLRHMPIDIEAHAILFEDGAFADALRAIGTTVHVVRASAPLIILKREEMRATAFVPALRVVLELTRVLSRERFALSYTNSMKAHLIGAIAGRIAGVPCVMHLHDHMSGWGLRALRVAAKLGSVHRIACSQEVSDAIAAGHTTVVYSPIELDSFATLPARDEAKRTLRIDETLPAVSIIGRINRWKGHDRFLRIAAAVHARRPSQFLIIGSPIFRDEDFLPELVDTVRRERMTDFVRFIPWVDDVRTAYAATDILVNCSHREPLGRTPAEATAAGIPSVIFSDSGAAEWLREVAESRIVEAGNESAMAEAVLDILDRVNTLNSENIRLGATRFEPEQVAKEIARIIRTYARAPGDVRSTRPT